eukprot:symbB.v1.2.020893.t1/scaffold1778.1/size101634/13
MKIRLRIRQRWEEDESLLQARMPHSQLVQPWRRLWRRWTFRKTRMRMMLVVALQNWKFQRQDRELAPAQAPATPATAMGLHQKWKLEARPQSR